MRQSRRSTGFTLIELLVVIAIIAILAAILFPVFSQARAKAVETQCLAHGKEIGTAVRMYVDDHSGKWPPLTGFNENPPPGSPGHKGPERTLEPYTKAEELFRCPADNGGNFTGGMTYYDRYGQSFQLSAACFSKIPGVSIMNDQDVTSSPSWFPQPYFEAKVVTDGEFQNPASTRIVREMVFPWFLTDEKYGMTTWYSGRWHARGGTVVFADGHAKFIASQEEFDSTAGCPEGLTTAQMLAAGRPDWW